jgi:uncharacterized integral membrane protein (TIGR00698 family)
MFFEGSTPMSSQLAADAGNTTIEAPKSVLARWYDVAHPLVPGLALVVVLGLIAQGLASLQSVVFGRIWLETLVLALMLGVLVRNVVPALSRFDLGAAYAGKQVLELSVVLLGVSVDATALAASGTRLATLIVVGVTTALLLGFLVGRLLGLGPRLAFLVATGNAICGNSAIAAVAPIINADKREIATSIALTAVLGVLLVLALPALIPLAGLSHVQYGVVAGMGVYAVPQVLAAAFPVSAVSGEMATMVKLGRVMLLGPLVVAVGVVMAVSGRGKPGARLRWSTFLPWFVLGFLVLAILRNVGAIPDPVAQPLRGAGTWLIVLAMAGLGLGVRLAAIRDVGPRVGVAVLVSLGVMIGLTLALLRVLAIDG